VAIRVNGGRWQAVPGTTFLFNPYNSYLRSTASGSTNPIAGQEAFTGVGGAWGTSRVDLAGLATGGDTIEIRFEFGKDGCAGLTGWYVDDVSIAACWDCDRDGALDERALYHASAVPAFFEVGAGRTPEHTLTDLPPAASDVTITAFGMGDFAFHDEFVTLELNGEAIAELFTVGAQDCATLPNAEVIKLGADRFNALTADGLAVLRLIGSEDVSPTLCADTTYVRLFLHYETTEPDENGNGVPDACERCVSVPIEEAAFDSNGSRYLSVRPPDTDEPVALRVTSVKMPGAGEVSAATSQWVGMPHGVSVQGIIEPGHVVAPLQCAPAYLSWTGTDRVDIYGAGILPGAHYRVEAVREFPGPFACVTWTISSEPPVAAEFATAPFGDVAGAAIEVGPDGHADFADISAAVAAYVRPVSLDHMLRADVHPVVPDQLVDMKDIATIIAAARGEVYPHTYPVDCR
jgi:hypothetical protein